MNMSPGEALSLSTCASVVTPLGRLHYRQAGAAAQATHVLLHGIGSSAASWAFQLAVAAEQPELKVLAWDAPGYGQSTHLQAAEPLAEDYARQVWDWLDALGQQAPVVLVGHSLGALMAASATRLAPSRVRGLVLLAPARGYGDAPAAERAQVLNKRLEGLRQLGPEGMARARSAAMLAPGADPALVEAVRESMARVDPAGYTQAAHMLAQGRLQADVNLLQTALTVASGELDDITPAAACAGVASAAGRRWQSLGPVGHACPLEAPDAVNALLGLPLGSAHAQGAA
jgi:pimeloyl-ACP methyl ester carboxylesterase